ncbi:MAG: hypothetical protein IKA83_06640 [Paludibacteraceae bacterium]|nr:hypothetical protein [Paludibacteraceae bacterium]
MKFKNKNRVTIQNKSKCIIHKCNSSKGISIVLKNQGFKKNNYKYTDKISTQDKPTISIDPPTAGINGLSVGIYKIKNNLARIKNDKKNKVPTKCIHRKEVATKVKEKSGERDEPTAGSKILHIKH